MALTQQQAACLAQARADIVPFYLKNGSGWSAANPGAIFTDWFNGTILKGAAPGDEAAQYPSVEAYAVAKGCAGGSASVVVGGGGSGSSSGGGKLPDILTGSNEATIGKTLKYWWDHDRVAFVLVTGLTGFFGYVLVKKAAQN